MLARIRSAAVLGIDAYLVEVEVDLAQGLPSFTTVGLPQGAVRESRERVTAAIGNSGFTFPLKRIVTNLAPADTPKSGTAFDLPIALGILVASGQLGDGRLSGTVVVGELGLEGALRPVKGALSIALAARSRGCARLLLPEANVAEAAVVDRLEVFGVSTLEQVSGFLQGTVDLTPTSTDATALLQQDSNSPFDFSEVRGQASARRALEVAAAGGHNILLVGPPGSGKTMLARRLPTILPAVTLAEALETTRIHSVAGLLVGSPLRRTRPFRAPHHTISDAGMIGGGSNPRPGEVSLAHGGVLFLDELSEFRRGVLEVLRQPLEDGQVTISRAALSLTYPARFMLAAAMNPCPCGHLGDTGRGCTCGSGEISRYLGRLSGPLLDRIDIHLAVPRVVYRDLEAPASSESSAAMRTRVEAARKLQRARFDGRAGAWANAHMGPSDVTRHCRLPHEARQLLRDAMKRLGLSARAYHRILKISRTIADLEGAASLGARHVGEAIQYRGFDRRYRQG